MVFNNIREKIKTMFILKAALKKTEIPGRPFFKKKIKKRGRSKQWNLN